MSYSCSLCINTGTLLQCIRCPVAYHAGHCVSAGVIFLGGVHIICTRHKVRSGSPINISWCLACSQGTGWFDYQQFMLVFLTFHKRWSLILLV